MGLEKGCVVVAVGLEKAGAPVDAGLGKELITAGLGKELRAAGLGKELMTTGLGCEVTTTAGLLRALT